jgi:hypothetical protein
VDPFQGGQLIREFYADRAAGSGYDLAAG